MCINPARLPDGTEFGCRKCWQCRENKVQDWVGRSIAQSKTSTSTFAVTLTYGGGDHERATVLTYSDVQKYFKRLRKAGFKFRYLVAGEYGARKGRAHWHTILFFDGPAPRHELRRNFQDPFWGHGHSFWDEPSPKALRYVCKYVLKAEDDQEAQAHFAMSKKPPIGHEYFMRMAHQYVDQGLSPKDLNYTFPENIDKEGKPVKHYMHGATARDFQLEYVHEWMRRHGNDRWPYSEMLDGGENKLGFLDTRPEFCYNKALEPLSPRFHDDVVYTYRLIDNCTRERYYAWQSETGELAPWEPPAAHLAAMGLDPSLPTSPASRPTPQAECATTSSEPPVSRASEVAQRKALRKRLPMVGDRWYGRAPSPRR